jgi:acetyl esterase/lipase
MIDVNRIVTTGESAGGHLSLTSAMIPESAGLDRQCAGAAAVPKPAAAINWFGITDVGDVIDGPNRANAAMTWFGSLPNREEVAKRGHAPHLRRAGVCRRSSRFTATPIASCRISTPCGCTTR